MAKGGPYSRPHCASVSWKDSMIGCATTAIMLSPDGKALLWASPQPLDSYQVIFDGMYGGHRVNTIAFDPINAVDPRNRGFTHTPPDDDGNFIADVCE